MVPSVSPSNLRDGVFCRPELGSIWEISSGEFTMIVQRKYLFLFVFGMLLVACPVAGGPNIPAPGNQEPAFQERFPRYRLRTGDILDLNFPFTPEFNQSVVVQPDGYINLRGIGEIRVQGKTTPEVVEALRAAYGRILRDPEVTVELKDFEKPYFIVGGEVAKPGKYDLRGDTTVVEAVTIAGGVRF